MNYKKLTFNFVIGAAIGGSLLLSSCGSGDKKEPEADGKDTASSPSLVKLGNAHFSIPSPFQTAMLIKATGAQYNKDILNSPKNFSKYSTNFKKAINLGVYGADVGYVTMYDQTQDALGYIGSIRKLTEELGINNGFDANTMKRFEQNLGKRDSMLSMVAVGYRASDAFLKDNDRLDVGALILTGGWIETLYFSTKVASAKNNQEIINRIGEQKYTLDNLIKLLQPYYNQPDYTELIDQLIDLAYDFDAIDIEYKYVKPVTDVANKTTTINSSTKVIISKEQLETISKKIEKIRTSIVG